MKFSLIIPIGPGRNAEMLKSIGNLDYPKKDYEVLIEQGTNPSENRNKGIKKAKGKFIVFLDDDAFLKENYLKKLEEFFAKYSKVDIVGGPQLNPEKGENYFAKISGVVLMSNFGAFKVNKRYQKSRNVYEAEQTDLTSANLCAKKEVFEKISGFNTSLFPGEDSELINRAKEEGLKVYYNPEMIIYHKRRESFPKYIRQIFNYGFTRPRLNKISKKGGIIFLIPLLFFIYFVSLPFFSLINKIFILPLIAYAILSVLFGIFESIKFKKLGGFFILPFLYLFTHLSYGLGMLAGYLKRK